MNGHSFLVGKVVLRRLDNDEVLVIGDCVVEYCPGDLRKNKVLGRTAKQDLYARYTAAVNIAIHHEGVVLTPVVMERVVKLGKKYASTC